MAYAAPAGGQPPAAGEGVGAQSFIAPAVPAACALPSDFLLLSTSLLFVLLTAVSSFPSACHVGRGAVPVRQVIVVWLP